MKTQLVYLTILLTLTGIAAAKYSGGMGEPNAPYLIATPNDLNSIGLDANDWSKHFKMTADINMVEFTDTQFHIIGTETEPFTGVFDGNGHCIGNFSYVTTVQEQYLGIFGHISNSNAQVTNLNLHSPNIDANEGKYVAALAGRLYEGKIAGCSISDANIRGEQYVGCLVGDVRFGIVDHCYSNGTVRGSWRFIGVLVGENYEGSILNSGSAGSAIGGVIPGSWFQYIGGLAGENFQGVISGCYSTANVTGHGIFAGGLIGSNWSVLEDSYALGDVSADEAVGGLVGYNTGSQGRIDRCYSAGKPDATIYDGGLVGVDEVDSVFDSFWDIETSDCNVSDGGIGLTTDEMQKRGTFTDSGWDMVNVWDIGESQTYPFLRTHLPSDINKDDTTNFHDFAILAEHWLEGI